MYEQITTISIFIFHGLIGGILYILINKIWRKRKEVCRRLIVSAISGYIYYLLHSSYSFPDSVMAIVFGYFSVDVIKKIFEEMLYRYFKSKEK